MSPKEDHDRLSALVSVLDTARQLVHDLHENPLLARLVDAFMRIPEGDREVLVGAIEREVQTRVISSEVADTLTHVELRPNPNARLYLRVVGPENDADPVEHMAFLRAAYSLQRGIDALDPSWQRMILQALRQMEPTARARLEEFNQAMQALLNEAATGADTESDATTPDLAGPPTDASLPKRR